MVAPSEEAAPKEASAPAEEAASAAPAAPEASASASEEAATKAAEEAATKAAEAAAEAQKFFDKIDIYCKEDMKKKLEKDNMLLIEVGSLIEKIIKYYNNEDIKSKLIRGRTSEITSKNCITLKSILKTKIAEAAPKEASAPAETDQAPVVGDLFANSKKNLELKPGKSPKELLLL